MCSTPLATSGGPSGLAPHSGSLGNTPTPTTWPYKNLNLPGTPRSDRVLFRGKCADDGPPFLGKAGDPDEALRHIFRAPPGGAAHATAASRAIAQFFLYEGPCAQPMREATPNWKLIAELLRLLPSNYHHQPTSKPIRPESGRQKVTVDWPSPPVPFQNESLSTALAPVFLHAIVGELLFSLCVTTASVLVAKSRAVSEVRT